ncbi:CoA transferase [Mycobacterium sp. WMMD1722]|uniref:CoA transferase n=1 Tax=Mycobacterium sp. WMMD1722 TaxID=3404117 RepID=UPI003BF461A3
MAAAVLTGAQRLADRLPVPLDATELLTGRAGLLGLPAPGRVSAGGGSRLLSTRDGWLALTLSRPADAEAVPALIEADEVDDDPWPAVTRWAAGRTAAQAVDRARLLGLPAAIPGETPPAEPTVRRVGARSAVRPLDDLLVVELASLWAGPLCGRLLTQAGARVVKVESRARPDGPRAGAPEFFDWMNAGKLSYANDLGDPRIRALLAVADVVIEGSRSAALARRGLGADRLPPRDGRVWVRITGYGAVGPPAEWVAFGDDAAVAGGLVGDGPAFLGDAIADPLTGLRAAVAVAESVSRGGGELVDIAMADVAAGYAALPSESEVALTPRRPRVRGRAAALGADNAVVDEFIDVRTAPC